MNQKEFQLVKQYVGIELLRFILNKSNLTNNDQFNSLNLNQNQINVLSDLYQKINSFRIQHVCQGGYGDEIELYLTRLRHNNENIFNHYRKLCGGNLPNNKKSNDPVLDFLELLSKNNYPNLLIKKATDNRIRNLDVQITVQEYEQFIDLIKNDVLDNLTNKKEGLEYSFQFTTICGLKFVTRMATASSIVISRSFQNCCNRMRYGFDDLYAEIAENIEFLRKLARGEEVEFASFIGIRGLIFDGMDQIDLKIATLRQLNSLSNPSLYTQKIAIIYSSEEGQYLSGTIVEVINKTKLGSLNIDTNYHFSEEMANHQHNILNNIKFSLLFTLEEDQGITSSVYESGFPLVIPGNYSFNDNSPQKHLILNENKVEKFRSWFELINKAELSFVQIPLKRLEYAIFQRRMPEDAIVDAIIAWEGMFSEAFETTFKVTGTIAKYLKEQPDREAFLNRIKKLYNLRSEIVHGKNSRLMKQEDIYDLRSEVIKIGLECLSKLLNDSELLPLSPAERVKKILIYD